MAKREPARRVPRVVHRSRPEIGVGEVNEIVAGKPPVLQVYWPKLERYGYYLATDVARLPDDDGGEPPAS